MNPALRRARALVGAPFRLQGRDPRTGIDCVGLVLLAYGLESRDAPSTYRFRGTSRDMVDAVISRHFDALAEDGDSADGDLALSDEGHGRLHLQIISEDGIIHADAALGRVTVRRGLPRGRVVGRYRLRSATKEG